MPAQARFSRAEATLSEVPGSAMPRCCSARKSAGVTSAIAARSLFCQPVMTSPLQNGRQRDGTDNAPKWSAYETGSGQARSHLLTYATYGQFLPCQTDRSRFRLEE
uniref:Uncharacterized protein n=1 Tax=Cupriavidus pinatubonensis (strain JMP 134 / LMG 1197) TaxID=264198 RepID=Q46RG6_CUPPJ